MNCEIKTFKLGDICQVVSAEFNFLGVWDKLIYEGLEYYGNPKVKVLKTSDNVKTKNVIGLNNLHHAVYNAVSLNATTAPKCCDCITIHPLLQ